MLHKTRSDRNVARKVSPPGPSFMTDAQMCQSPLLLTLSLSLWLVEMVPRMMLTMIYLLQPATLQIYVTIVLLVPRALDPCQSRLTQLHRLLDQHLRLLRLLKMLLPGLE